MGEDGLVTAASALVLFVLGALLGTIGSGLVFGWDTPLRMFGNIGLGGFIGTACASSRAARAIFRLV